MLILKDRRQFEASYSLSLGKEALVRALKRPHSPFIRRGRILFISTSPLRRAALGGYLWEFVSPEIAFTIVAVGGAVGTGYFLLFGEEFKADR